MTDTETQIDIKEVENAATFSEDVPPPPKVRKQRPKKYETEQEYNRRYYHDVLKNKEPEVCPYCNLSVVCRSSLLRHQRRSKHCSFKRLEAELAELKSNISILDLDKANIELLNSLTNQILNT